jgi:hypothetical protein
MDCQKSNSERVKFSSWPAIFAAGFVLAAGADSHLAAQEIDSGDLATTEHSIWLGLAYALIATLLLLAVIWVVLRIRVWTLARLERSEALSRNVPATLVTDLRGHVLQAGQVLTRLIAAVTVGFLIYLWVVYSLRQFPYTVPWGEQLGQFLIQMFLSFGAGLVGAVPGLFGVLVIILAARWCVRLINIIFKEVEKEKLSLPWIERETARTTQTLLIVTVWLFALVAAYPYIPGSDTNAFKGLTVLLGLMVTLGSTGLMACRSRFGGCASGRGYGFQRAEGQRMTSRVQPMDVK